MYKKSEQDLAPISMSSKEVPLTLGLIDFKEDHISLYINIYLFSLVLMWTK